MKVTFFNHRRWRIQTSIFNQVRERIDRYFPAMKPKKIDVIFVDDSTIQILNRDYLGRDYSTDVLSFTYNEGDLLGELYISMDTLKRNAKEYEHGLVDELNKIFVHGFLHLHGHTHDSVQDTREMSRLEERILDSKNCSLLSI